MYRMFKLEYSVNSCTKIKTRSSIQLTTQTDNRDKVKDGILNIASNHDYDGGIIQKSYILSSSCTRR